MGHVEQSVGNGPVQVRHEESQSAHELSAARYLVELHEEHSVDDGPVQVRHEGSHDPQELSPARYLVVKHEAHSVDDGPVQVKQEESHGLQVPPPVSKYFVLSQLVQLVSELGAKQVRQLGSHWHRATDAMHINKNSFAI